MDFPVSLLTKCWFMAGPTAVGKTSTALHLAEQIDAEIVSLDSMAVYRGMDIGTAKPTASERDSVPHYLIDVVDVSEDFSVSEYVSAAVSVCRAIVENGRIPLFVGGTGLYLRSLLRGLSSGPQADWPLRDELAKLANSEGPQELHQQLQRIDPRSAEKLPPTDVRRVIRAIEVYRTTGKPLSATHNHGPRPGKDRPAVCIWLEPPRPWLHERINQRVDLMMDAGLEQETRWLLNHDPPAGRTARQALGYRELIEHFDGRFSREEAVDLIRTRTRQFAKRQHTWFRNLEECTALSIDAGSPPKRIAGQIITFAQQHRKDDTP